MTGVTRVTAKAKAKVERKRILLSKAPSLSETIDKDLALPVSVFVKRAQSSSRAFERGLAPPDKTLSKRAQSSSDSIDRDLAPPVSILPKKGPKRLTAKEKRSIMIRNVTQVLKNTTVMPFRWLKSSYRCFYCYEIFQESSDLKAHQPTHDPEAVIEKTMNNYWEPVVYLDISNMSCKLCPETVPDLYDMVDHLIAKHDVVFNKDIGMCMVSFKLDNFNLSCLICGAAFFTFGPLLYHTNKAHKGTNVLLCELCGQHFKHKNLLRLHVKSVHENASFLCPDCGDKFESQSKLKTHQKAEHLVEKKYKCLVCTQTFQSHYKRSRHMATEHENRQVIKCLQCPKTFIFRSMMMTHLRDTHLKLREHVCSVCGWRAFNSNRLKNHMFKHSGERNFKCEACGKAFSTKKIMKAHFMRMHKTPQQSVVSYPNLYGP